MIYPLYTHLRYHLWISEPVPMVIPTVYYVLVAKTPSKFGEQLTTIAHHGGICLSVSTGMSFSNNGWFKYDFHVATVFVIVVILILGVQLGLFEALIEIAPNKEAAVTSKELADHLNYKVR